MRIAITDSQAEKGYTRYDHRFLYEVFDRLAKKYPVHEFVVIENNSPAAYRLTGPNIQTVITHPAFRTRPLQKFWYTHKLASVLKKIKADVCVAGSGVCSLSSGIPQCLLLTALPFLPPAGTRQSLFSFYQKNRPQFIAKARRIITLSAAGKSNIVKGYATDPSKISVVYGGVSPQFEPLHEEEKKRVKEKYTNGKEYFVCAAAAHSEAELVCLLKAFSLFKKRQQSGMKLVMTEEGGRYQHALTASIKNYKYREDVVITDRLTGEELRCITAAAYASVFITAFDDGGLPVLEAMKCGVPVITASSPVMQEITGEAALYAGAGDPGSIAGQLMLLYKDENLRNDLIAKAGKVAEGYSWDRTAEEVWQVIQEIYGSAAPRM